MNETTADYWLTLTNEKSIRAIAKNTGLDQSKVNRQLNGTSDLRVQTVVAICRVYGLEMAPVFVKAGFITEEEAAAFSANRQLRAYSDIDLSKEMLRRVTEGSATEAITEPVASEILEQVIREERADNVTQMPGVGGTKQDPSKMTDVELDEAYPDRLAADKSTAEQDLDDRTP